MAYVRFLFVFLVLMSSNVYSEEADVSSSEFTTKKIENDSEQSLGDSRYSESKLIVEIIERLVDDGFLTEEHAEDAKKRYVFENSELDRRVATSTTKENHRIQADKSITWSELLSLSGAVKLLAVVFLLFSLRGIIIGLAKSLYQVILLVPVIVYQLASLMLSTLLTFFPSLVWPSEAFYLAITGSILQLLVLWWIAVIYKTFTKNLIKWFSFGLKPSFVLGVYVAAYFGGLAILYQSSLFGVLTVAAFVYVTGFVIYQLSDGIALGVDDERYLPAVILSSFLVLLTYGLIAITDYHLPYLEYFTFGIEYVCSLALSVCLLIATLPRSRKGKFFIFCSFLMVISFVLALVGATLFDLTTISAFMNTVFALWLLWWVGYLGTKLGFIVFSLVLSACLYGLALLLEQHADYFIVGLF